MKTISFKKKVLATAIGSYALAGFSGMAIAQGSDPMIAEEVVVTGIRGSLMRSMDIKRDAQGVVDAISAEDIGKFPDTNLADSLQRITGVSISRSNNEGNEVTVRGFGPAFNLVTLNGRQMPTAGNSRSFQFSDLAAESVSGVVVHKTFRADAPSGGIGSAIDIETARPLDNPGLQFSVGAKAIQDTTNVEGDDITPEVSGILSSTFADDTFGVLISGSYQDRSSRLVTADIASWRNNLDDLENGPDMSLVEDNRADPTGPTFYPRNFGLGIDDISRQRTNAQAVFQYAPTDALTATLDYTYTQTDYEALNTGTGIWFSDTGANLVNGIIDENGTFVRVTEHSEDWAANTRLNTSEIEGESVGLNLDWQVNDNLNLTFDAHDSSRLDQGVGRGNDVFLILGAQEIATKTYDATAGLDIPYMEVIFDDDTTDGDPAGIGVVDNMMTAASFDSLFGQAGTNINRSDVTQFQVGGVWESDNSSGLTAIDFGLAQTEINNRWRSFNTGQLPLGFYNNNHHYWPDEMFTAVPYNGQTPSFTGGESNVPVYYAWDWDTGVAIAEALWADVAATTANSVPAGGGDPTFPNWSLPATNGAVMRTDLTADPVSDHTVIEDTTSAYLQTHMESDIEGMPLEIVAGIRYESTEIVSSSFQQDPLTLTWINSTEWSMERATESTYTHEVGEYDVWLPNLDAQLEVTSDVVARLSYSQSITRPTLGSMIGTMQVTSRPKPGERTGTAGNPDLSPFISNNFDLSAEWYYADASYASVGVFVKQVSNFIVDQIIPRTVLNLRDPQNGARAEAARAYLSANGIPVTDANVFDRINTVDGTPGPIAQADSDPLALFQISTPTNMEDAQLQGLEAAIQHTFGDSGFGTIFNFTLVGGDLQVDNASTDFQFVLPGLSDSANLIAFYDKNGLQGRIAYNWRDTFLNGVGENNTPYYTEAYGQVDAFISYEVLDGLTVSLEGVNINDASQRVYSRYENQFKSASQYGARYNLGVRYTF